MDKKRLEALIKRHQDEKSVLKIEDIETNLAIPKGENYLSIVERIKAKVLLGSGRRATIYFITKNIPKEEGRNKFVRDLGAFKSETQVYLQVLKEMENLMREMDDRRDTLWPDLIGYQPYDMLIFNDLVWENFKVPPRQECQDLDHIMLTMTELARFHAMSKILLVRGIVRREDFSMYVFARDQDIFRRFVGKNIEKFGEVIQNKWDPEWRDIGRLLKQSSKKLEQKCCELGPVDESRFNIINHGDVRTSNMMFKYATPSKKPIALKLVDYQLCHYNSVGWDLTYYLYSSVETTIRRENYKAILKKYTDSLKETLLRFGYPEQDIPSLQDVLDDMNRMAAFRIASMVFIRLLMMTKTVEEPLDMEAAVNSKIEDVAAYPDSVFEEDEIVASTKPDLKDFAKMNLI